jgi:multidrug resistance protein, MATE family
LKYLSEYSRNLKIGIPVALSQLGHIAVTVADTIIVGKLGGVQLGAITIAVSVLIPFMMFGIGLSYGVSPLIAKADGEGDREVVGILFKQSLVINSILGLLLSLVLVAGSGLLMYLDQPADVAALALPCFQLLALSLFPVMIFQAFRQFAEGLGKTTEAMVVSIGGNVLNIVLNYILVYGKVGFPVLGAPGSAAATLIARIVMAMGIFIMIWKSGRFDIYLEIFSTAKVSMEKIWKILKVSIPVGLQLSLETGAFGCAALMVGWIGTDEIAAHQIALNLAAVSYMSATGIASATTVRVGNGLGRKDYSEIRLAGYAGIHMVLLFMALTAVIFVLFRYDLPQLYIGDGKIQHIASSLLFIAGIFQISDGLQVVSLGALRGIGDVRIPTVIALVAYWVVGLPSGYFFAFMLDLNVEGVWYGLLLGLSTAAILLLTRFNSKSRMV